MRCRADQSECGFRAASRPSRAAAADRRRRARAAAVMIGNDEVTPPDSAASMRDLSRASWAAAPSAPPMLAPPGELPMPLTAVSTACRA
jgi:hypothetical protein